jgi:hypothetical protein
MTLLQAIGERFEYARFQCTGTRYRLIAKTRRSATKRISSFVQLTVTLAFAFLSLACTTQPDVTQFKAGMARTAIVEQFGEPASKQTLVKTSLHIFGPIEDFWSSLPDQARVEIWSYRTQGGNVELYFVNGAEIASGRSFAPTGIVY